MRGILYGGVGAVFPGGHGAPAVDPAVEDFVAEVVILVGEAELLGAGLVGVAVRSGEGDAAVGVEAAAAAVDPADFDGGRGSGALGADADGGAAFALHPAGYVVAAVDGVDGVGVVDGDVGVLSHVGHAAATEHGTVDDRRVGGQGHVSMGVVVTDGNDYRLCLGGTVGIGDGDGELGVDVGGHVEALEDDSGLPAAPGGAGVGARIGVGSRGLNVNAVDVEHQVALGGGGDAVGYLLDHQVGSLRGRGGGGGVVGIELEGAVVEVVVAHDGVDTGRAKLVGGTLAPVGVDTVAVDLFVVVVVLGGDEVGQLGGAFHDVGGDGGLAVDSQSRDRGALVVDNGQRGGLETVGGGDFVEGFGVVGDGDGQYQGSAAGGGKVAGSRLVVEVAVVFLVQVVQGGIFAGEHVVGVDGHFGALVGVARHLPLGVDGVVHQPVVILLTHTVAVVDFLHSGTEVPVEPGGHLVGGVAGFHGFDYQGAFRAHEVVEDAVVLLVVVTGVAGTVPYAVDIEGGGLDSLGIVGVGDVEFQVVVLTDSELLVGDEGGVVAVGQVDLVPGLITGLGLGDVVDSGLVAAIGLRVPRGVLVPREDTVGEGVALLGRQFLFFLCYSLRNEAQNQGRQHRYAGNDSGVFSSFHLHR